MPRLPRPGSDDGEWGEILNDFLLVSHDDNGSLKRNSVNSSTLAAGSVSASKIQDQAITEAKLNSAVTNKLNNPGSANPATSTSLGTVQLSGDLSGTAIEPVIGSGKITTEKIANNSVTSSKLADDSVASENIVNGSVTKSKLSATAGSNGQVLTVDSSSPGGLKWAQGHTGQKVWSGSSLPINAQNGDLWVDTTDTASVTLKVLVQNTWVALS